MAPSNTLRESPQLESAQVSFCLILSSTWSEERANFTNRVLPSMSGRKPVHQEQQIKFQDLLEEKFPWTIT